MDKFKKRFEQLKQKHDLANVATADDNQTSSSVHTNNLTSNLTSNLKKQTQQSIMLANLIVTLNNHFLQDMQTQDHHYSQTTRSIEALNQFIKPYRAPAQS